jgi:hypothetical protein
MKIETVIDSIPFREFSWVQEYLGKVHDASLVTEQNIKSMIQLVLERSFEYYYESDVDEDGDNFCESRLWREAIVGDWSGLDDLSGDYVGELWDSVKPKYKKSNDKLRFEEKVASVIKQMNKLRSEAQKKRWIMDTETEGGEWIFERPM